MDRPILITITFLAVVLIIIFNSGRLYQRKLDKIILDQQLEQYNELFYEYQDYKKNSYILHH